MAVLAAESAVVALIVIGGIVPGTVLLRAGFLLALGLLVLFTAVLLCVFGDNPHNNVDSRRWGPLPFHSLQGVAFASLPRKRAAVQHSRRDPVTTTKKEVC